MTPTKTPTKTAAKAPAAKAPAAKAPANKAAPKPSGKARVVHANITEATYQKWQEFSVSNGVSVSGIVEALGSVGPISGGGNLSSADLIKAAREVDAKRRRRGGRS